jgi:hypothetical protein
MGEQRKLYRILVGKPEGKRPLGRAKRRWEDEIILYLRDICWTSVEWIQLTEDISRGWALVNMVTNLRVLAPRT